MSNESVLILTLRSCPLLDFLFGGNEIANLSQQCIPCKIRVYFLRITDPRAIILVEMEKVIASMCHVRFIGANTQSKDL